MAQLVKVRLLTKNLSTMVAYISFSEALFPTTLSRIQCETLEESPQVCVHGCLCLFYRNLSLSYYGDLMGYGLINDPKVMVVAGISRSYPGNQLERGGVWTLSQSKVWQDFMQEEGMASTFLLSISLKLHKESKSQTFQHCLIKTCFVVGKGSCDSLHVTAQRCRVRGWVFCIFEK